jgi:uncharacterized protein YodC (DUF2158 family)
VNFHIGDRVKLKSGGPLMVIIELDDAAQTAKCQWFAKDDLKHEDVFLFVTLTNYDNPG